MKRLLTTAFVLAFTLPLPLSLGQTHAPLIQKCTSDAKAWQAEAQSAANVHKGSITVPQMFDRIDELDTCDKTYPDPEFKNPERMRWIILSNIYSAAITRRVGSYLKRHNEMNQFMAEDAAGKR